MISVTKWFNQFLANLLIYTTIWFACIIFKVEYAIDQLGNFWNTFAWITATAILLTFIQYFAKKKFEMKK